AEHRRTIRPTTATAAARAEPPPRGPTRATETVRKWRRLSPHAVASAPLPRTERRGKAAPPAGRTTRRRQGTRAREKSRRSFPDRARGSRPRPCRPARAEAVGLKPAEKSGRHAVILPPPPEKGLRFQNNMSRSAIYSA